MPGEKLSAPGSLWPLRARDGSRSGPCRDLVFGGGIKMHSLRLRRLDGPDHAILGQAHRMRQGLSPERLERAGARGLFLAPLPDEGAALDVAAQNLPRSLPHLFGDEFRSPGERAILAG